MSADMSIVEAAVTEAMGSAAKATREFLAKHGDRDACGFAWVTTYEKGTSKLVRELKKFGFSKSYGGGYQLWNPSKSYTQSISALEAGADAAAEVLTRRLGVKFYSGSRMD
jgi:ribosomal protein S27AE